jgi:hypothetical protein
MKKIFVSVGLAAGAAGLSSALAQGLEAAAPKLWNVSANLRGFYDDNYTVSNKKQGSFGFEVSPSVSANADLQQTDVGIRYTFGMYYYFDRDGKGQNPIDYTHQADFWLDHAFDETLKATVTDSFVVAQDPQLVEGGITTRVKGNNIANRAKVSLAKEWTRQFSTVGFYGNNLIVYSDEDGTPGNPSPDALLSRIEQYAGVDFQWQFEKETTGFIGYKFAWTHYTGSKEIAPSIITPGGLVQYFSDARDNQIHYGYVGVTHKFSPNLSATAQAGASYVDNYNDPISSTTSWTPYADISATYTFTPGSFLLAGFTQDISPTSVASPGADGHLTQYQESSIFYMNLTHQFDAKLSGSLVGQYVYSSFKDGVYDSQADNEVNVGVNLTYQFNRYISADAGYSFNELFSDVAGRSYSRNRVYLGLAARY